MIHISIKSFAPEDVGSGSLLGGCEAFGAVALCGDRGLLNQEMFYY